MVPAGRRRPVAGTRHRSLRQRDRMVLRPLDARALRRQPRCAERGPRDDRFRNTVAYSTGWSSVIQRAARLGGVHLTRRAGAKAVFSLDHSERLPWRYGIPNKPTGFQLIGDRCSRCGSFRVYVDGRLVGTYSSRSETTRHRTVLVSVHLSSTKRYTSSSSRTCRRRAEPSFASTASPFSSRAPAFCQDPGGRYFTSAPAASSISSGVSRAVVATVAPPPADTVSASAAAAALPGRSTTT